MKPALDAEPAIAPVEWATGLGEIFLGREYPEGVVRRMDGVEVDTINLDIKSANSERLRIFADTGKWIFDEKETSPEVYAVVNGYAYWIEKGELLATVLSDDGEPDFSETVDASYGNGKDPEMEPMALLLEQFLPLLSRLSDHETEVLRHKLNTGEI